MCVVRWCEGDEGRKEGTKVRQKDAGSDYTRQHDGKRKRERENMRELRCVLCMKRSNGNEEKK